MTGVKTDTYRFTPAAYPAWIHDTTTTPACRGTDLAIWFPTSKRDSQATAAARAVCRRCPLLTTCRDWALSQPVEELHGIWGGTTRSDRRQLRTRVRQEAA